MNPFSSWRLGHVKKPVWSGDWIVAYLSISSSRCLSSPSFIFTSVFTGRGAPPSICTTHNNYITLCKHSPFRTHIAYTHHNLIEEALLAFFSSEHLCFRAHTNTDTHTQFQESHRTSLGYNNRLCIALHKQQSIFHDFLCIFLFIFGYCIKSGRWQIDVMKVCGMVFSPCWKWLKLSVNCFERRQQQICYSLTAEHRPSSHSGCLILPCRTTLWS